MGDFRRTKMNWTKPSVNKMMPGKEMREAARKGTFRISSPWDQQDEDLVEEFDRNLQSLNATVKSPWEEGSTELRAMERNQAAARDYKMTSLFDEDPDIARKQAEQVKAAKEYKYQSMFEVPPLTEKQQRMIDEYQMNPPFRTSYNIVPEEKKTAKKLAPGKNPPTRQPWTYGSVPADPVPMKIFQRPPTALWSVPPKVEDADNQMPSSGDPVLDSLRVQLKKQGSAGIAGLSRKFRIMDDDQSGTLDMQEFVKGMKECKIADLSEKAIKHLFRYFDTDDSGVISYNEFLVGVRGVLSERRRQLVHLAFRILDRDGSGQVEMADIQGVYNAQSHPDVVMGKRSEQEILTEFMQAFQVGKEKDAIITKEEFENYYANLSASIDRDDYFELMIRNAWHISGGEGWAANTTNKRVLVTHADGRQTVEEIQNDIGLRADDKKGMVQRLKAQGLKMASINTNGLGDMGNQYEDPDFYKYRQEAMAQQQQEQGVEGSVHSGSGGGSGRGSESRRVGASLADYARPGSSAGAAAMGARPAPVVNGSGRASAPAPGAPQRLADYVAGSGTGAGTSAGLAYNTGAAVGSAYNTSSAPAATQAAPKPVSLSSFVNNLNSAVGGSRKR